MVSWGIDEFICPFDLTLCWVQTVGAMPTKVPFLQRCHAMSLLATDGGGDGEYEFNGGS